MSDLPSVVELDDDISNAEAPAPLPIGEYNATIRASEMQTSKSGNLMARVTFAIAPDEYPADFTDGNPDGESLLHFQMMNTEDARTRYRLKKFIETIGAPKGKRIDVSDWIGLEAKVRVEHEEYDGEVRARIARVIEA